MKIAAIFAIVMLAATPAFGIGPYDILGFGKG